MKNFIKINILTWLVGCSVISCSDDLTLQKYDNPGERNILTAVVTLKDSEIPLTRVGIRNEDGWTYNTSGFTAGDMVGLYTRAGNINHHGGNGIGMYNMPMTFAFEDFVTENGQTDPRSTLKNDTVEVNTSAMTSNSVFMYYPYDPDMGNIWNYNQETGNTVRNSQGDEHYLKGMELRKLDPKDNIVKCKDIAFLYSATDSYLKSGIISGAFYHLFCELQIVRGEGFNNLPDNTPDDIWIVMKEGVSHMDIVSYIPKEKVRWTNQFFYNNDYVGPDGSPMNREDCRRWQCWKGKSRTLEEGKAVDCYWVVLPAVYLSQGQSTANGVGVNEVVTTPQIQHIELYDNQGLLQKVSSINFTVGSSSIGKNTRYRYLFPLQIKTGELEATASPIDIDNWTTEGEDKNITDERQFGIKSKKEYNEWAQYYAQWKSETDQTEKERLENILLTYGNKDENGIWHFYLNTDLDYTQNNPEDPDYVDHITHVSELTDVLEGADAFFNVEIKGLKLTEPLFGTIKGNGGIRNISFDGIYVKSESEPSLGALAKTITGSSNENSCVFIKCNIIDGTVIGKETVGLMAGSITNGSINHCDFSGSIMGESTATTSNWSNLFGSITSPSPKGDNNNFNNLIQFIKSN